MITYQEYYAKMQRISAALNSKVADSNCNPASSINCFGYLTNEAHMMLVGHFFHALCAINPANNNISCALAILIRLFRQYCLAESTFDFHLFEPSEAEQDSEFVDEWTREIVAISRSNRYILVGSCAMPDMPFDPLSNMAEWCVYQAYRIATYCITHDIDIERIISTL